MSEQAEKEVRVRIEGPAISPKKEKAKSPERDSLPGFYSLLIFLTYGCLGGSLFLLYLAFTPELQPWITELQDQLQALISRFQS
jgi:hypothetical protein